MADGALALDLMSRLRAISAPAPSTLGMELGAVFVEDHQHPNQYWSAWVAALPGPVFGAARLSLPLKGAAVHEARLVLDAVDGNTVVEADLTPVLGPPEIFQILPNKFPEGAVTMKYAGARPVLLVEYTYKSRRLLLAVLVWDGVKPS